MNTDSPNVHYCIVLDKAPTLGALALELYKKVQVIPVGRTATVDLVIAGRLASSIFTGSRWSHSMAMSYIKRWSACVIANMPNEKESIVTLHPDFSVEHPPSPQEPMVAAKPKVRKAA